MSIQRIGRLTGRLASGMAVVIFAVVLLLPASGQSNTLSPEEKARKLFKRLTGTPMPAGNSRLSQMTSLVAAGKLREAARVATEDRYFYQVTVRDWAAPMSNRAGDRRVPFNDFQAMVVGVARDDLDARTLLTGDFTYVGQGVIPPAVPGNNAHYVAMDAAGSDLKAVLRRVEPQRADLRDAAGVLTSRAWAAAHFEGGTNRRATVFAIQEFLCQPIEQWKDVGLPDWRIRRDVDRAPEGNPARFQGFCRNCHAGMDALTGAFARFDWDGFRLVYFANRIAPKINQNAGVYPGGYVTLDDSWINYSTQNHNQSFGWRGPLEGNGPREFGRMLSESAAFSACMAKRVFNDLCGRDPAEAEQAGLAKHFENSGYKLRSLFEETAITPGCVWDETR